jgi:hypothetical protein
MRLVVCKEPLRASRGAVLLAACIATGRDVTRGASRAMDGEEEGACRRAVVMVTRMLLPMDGQNHGGAAAHR